mmetsp:Transcript_33441/g.117204  ORF Transcript_33441/g.117204 Transcript_33441/m.117204 type:complete len:235 (-) Transcript_33441:243-947(-)
MSTCAPRRSWLEAFLPRGPLTSMASTAPVTSTRSRRPGRRSSKQRCRAFRLRLQTRRSFGIVAASNCSVPSSNSALRRFLTRRALRTRIVPFYTSSSSAGRNWAILAIPFCRDSRPVKYTSVASRTFATTRTSRSGSSIASRRSSGSNSKTRCTVTHLASGGRGTSTSGAAAFTRTASGGFQTLAAAHASLADSAETTHRISHVCATSRHRLACFTRSTCLGEMATTAAATATR